MRTGICSPQGHGHQHASPEVRVIAMLLAFMAFVLVVTLGTMLLINQQHGKPAGYAGPQAVAIATALPAPSPAPEKPATARVAPASVKPVVAEESQKHKSWQDDAIEAIRQRAICPAVIGLDSPTPCVWRQIQ